MARGSTHYTDRYLPEFGFPYDYSRQEKLEGLPERELILLAEFRAWMEGAEQLTREDVTGRLGAMPPHLRQLATYLWVEYSQQVDPIQFGWLLPSWQEVCDQWAKYTVHCICGGNRSSKSVFAARLMVWLVLNIPEARLRCFHVNDEKSISEQQAYIWDALPARFKNFARKRGTAHSIQYTQKNGFVGGKLIVPPMRGYQRGGEIIFGTYQQYRNDPQTVEGWWAHSIWCDEEAPQKMFERLLTRLYDARGRMILTFTTIQGWSPLVADILGKTRTVRKRLSPLLNREIPVAQESISRPGTRIYYFWTSDNPFIPPESSLRLKGRPVEEILAVAHGIPSKPSLSKFPKFDPTVHVIPHGELPWLLPGAMEKEEPPEFTRYHVIDPSGSKPWFMLWLAVDSASRIYVYRETPAEAEGNWGEQGDSPEGRAGPAMRPNGWGILEYVERIKEAEMGEAIFERLIDPRLGAALTQAKEGATSIISELEEAGMTVLPAPGLMIDHGLQLINDRFSYDTTKDVGPLNHPRLYISDRCSNTIEALKNYTGYSKDEVWKDPVDCIRYALEAGADFIGKGDLSNSRRTFSY